MTRLVRAMSFLLLLLAVGTAVRIKDSRVPEAGTRPVAVDVADIPSIPPAIVTVDASPQSPAVEDSAMVPQPEPERALDVIFGDGAVRVSPVGKPDHALELQLEEVRAGDRVLATGGPAWPRSGERAGETVFARGPVIERYTLRSNGLEQDFVIESLPVPGDIRVSCRVATALLAPAEGTVAPRLEFRGRDETLTVSDAVAVDAAGRRLPLDLTYARGIISMTVPASWVESATYPITIDPLVGSTITIDAAGGDSPDVAWGATRNEWLAVWSKGTTAPASAVYGQRVAQNGSLVGSPILIGSANLKNYSPRVCYSLDVDRYLVVWQSLDRDYVDFPPAQLRARILNGDGTPYTAEFSVTTQAAAEQPNVAYDGHRWFVCWRQVVYGTFPYPSAIRGQFIRRDGKVEETADPDPTAVDKRGPRLIFANGSYVIAWPEVAASPVWQLKARVMTAAGEFSPPVVVEPNLAQYTSGIDASACADKVLFQWGTTAGELRGRISTPWLTFAAPSFVIRTGWPAPLSPFAGATKLRWLALYQGPNNNGNIQANQITTTGTVGGNISITTNGQNNVQPRACWSGQSSYFLIVYRSGTTAPLSIKAWRFDLDAPTMLPAPSNVTATPGNGRVSLTWGATSGATWYEIWRTTDPALGFPGYPIGTTNAPTYEDSSPTNGTRYWYMVRAFATAKASGISVPVSATPLPPPAPTNLTATGGNGKVSLTWGPSPGATLYKVFRGVASGSYDLYIAVPAGTSYTDSGLTNGVTYYYVVVGASSQGDSAPSNEASATPNSVP